MKKLILLASHLLAIALGFAVGVYALPILIAPPAPSDGDLAVHAATAAFKGEFRRNLADSDALHWGEGSILVSADNIAFMGKLAPGPDYKLYLSPNFVETEADFMRLKASMVRVGDIETFENFLIPVPTKIDVSRYDTVVVWCETFSQFITSAKYK
jgi:hypothetical protein